MKRANLIRTATVGGVCAVAGAAAGIAGSAASPSGHASAQQRPWKAGAFAHHRFGPRGRVVHAQAVVLNRARNGFVTVTMDRGRLKSASGDQLTLTEGVGSVTYKDVTLTIPSGAKVRRDRAKATLGDLKAGDRVVVAQSPEGTFVIARDPSFRPRGAGMRARRGFGYGPPGAGGP